MTNDIEPETLKIDMGEEFKIDKHTNKLTTFDLNSICNCPKRSNKMIYIDVDGKCIRCHKQMGQ